MRFFDSLPTTQSRLLTFRCPYYKTRTNVRHYVTIAWKSKEPSDEGISLLSENVEYVGKPLAIFPSAISASYKKDVFPAGTLYATCSCMPERNGKICYISTEVSDGTSATASPDETSKIRKRLEDDFKVTNRLLVQLYDVLEDIQKVQRKNQKEIKGLLDQYINETRKQKEINEKKLSSITNFLTSLPYYMENRFYAIQSQEDFDTSLFRTLKQDTEELRKSLADKSDEKVLEKIQEKLNDATQEKDVSEEKEEYLDLFSAESSLKNILEEPQPAPTPAKTFNKNSFSVTQVLNKSALARQIKDQPNAQELEKIFFMDDKMPENKKKKEKENEEE